ncbi:MAG: hypothetical protein ACK4QL_00270 [Pseudanabaenaceae cyanobacterium]
MCRLLIPSLGIFSAYLLWSISVNAEVIPLEPVSPSMWWIVERSPLGWVRTFSVDYNNKSVKLVLETSLWNRADYLERFSLVRRLGLEAQKVGYSLVLVDDRDRVLVKYQSVNGNWQITPANLGAFPFRSDTGR